MLVREASKAQPHFATLAAVLVIFAVILLIVFTRMRRELGLVGLADEVLDGGDYLVVRFGKKRRQISMSNVADVAVERGIGTTVRLRLSTPCEFGTVISFLASYRNPSEPNQVAEDLIARVRARGLS
jgi:hypothetical protein